MKLLSHLLVSLLVLSLWACSGTKTESNQDTAEADEAPKTEEPAAAASDEGMSNDLYSVKVLKGDIPSPMKELSASFGETEVKIVYGSPSVKGRELYGGLVPYGDVWRTGANEATTFEASTDVEVGGKTLPAGKYGFFTIPGEGEWTLVFNSVSDQWGAYDYDADKDVLRVTATPAASDDMSETMEFMRTDENTLAYHWGNLTVPFTVAAK
ncbi:MAG: DUF2911 domain-containing protein [Bacteroidota bacterium]